MTNLRIYQLMHQQAFSRFIKVLTNYCELVSFTNRRILRRNRFRFNRKAYLEHLEKKGFSTEKIFRVPEIFIQEVKGTLSNLKKSMVWALTTNGITPEIYEKKFKRVDELFKELDEAFFEEDPIKAMKEFHDINFKDEKFRIIPEAVKIIKKRRLRKVLKYSGRTGFLLFLTVIGVLALELGDLHYSDVNTPFTPQIEQSVEKGDQTWFGSDDVLPRVFRGFDELNKVTGFNLYEEVDVPDSNLVETFIYPVANPKGIFILTPGWGTEHTINKTLRPYLMKNGYTVLEFEVTDHIMSWECEKTEKRFQKSVQLMVQEIQRLQTGHGFNELNFIATSLGNVFLNMTTSALQEKGISVHDVYMIIPGHSLAEAFWDGMRTTDGRRQMQAHGMKKGMLVSCWLSLAPINNLKHCLRNPDGTQTRIKIFFGRNDKVISPRGLPSMFDRMKSLGAKVEAHPLNAGHYFIAGDFYLNPWKYIKF